MAQTTDGMSFSDVDFEYQIDGDTTATDASGFITSIEVSGYETQIGEAYTGDGDTALLTAGKVTPAEITANTIYTSNAADPHKKLWDAKDQKKKVRFIWYPKGKAAGNPVFTSDYGLLQSVSAPAGEASSADAVLCTAILRSPKITPSTVPAS